MPSKSALAFRTSALAFALLCCLLLSILGSAAGTLAAAPAQSWQTAYVSFVYDGDTVAATLDGKELKLRLYGIDAPEQGQAFAEPARALLQKLIWHRRIRVQLLNRDRYGRTIARLSLADGRDVSQEMVKAGLAWWYRQYAPNDASLSRLQTEAKSARRGLWAKNAPTAPWEFRRHTPKPASKRSVRTALVAGSGIAQATGFGEVAAGLFTVA